jgi:flagellar hook assembly protein FlgD
MTELSFTTSREGMVRVAVYDMQGRLVKTLLGEFRAAGEQRVAWDGSNAQSQKVASGVYFFRVLTSEGGFTQRVAVVK